MAKGMPCALFNLACMLAIHRFLLPPCARGALNCCTTGMPDSVILVCVSAHHAQRAYAARLYGWTNK